MSDLKEREKLWPLNENTPYDEKWITLYCLPEMHI